MIPAMIGFFCGFAQVEGPKMPFPNGSAAQADECPHFAAMGVPVTPQRR